MRDSLFYFLNVSFSYEFKLDIRTELFPACRHSTEAKGTTTRSLPFNGRVTNPSYVKDIPFKCMLYTKRSYYYNVNAYEHNERILTLAIGDDL